MSQSAAGSKANTARCEDVRRAMHHQGFAEVVQKATPSCQQTGGDTHGAVGSPPLPPSMPQFLTIALGSHWQLQGINLQASHAHTHTRSSILSRTSVYTHAHTHRSPHHTHTHAHMHSHPHPIMLFSRKFADLGMSLPCALFTLAGELGKLPPSHESGIQTFSCDEAMNKAVQGLIQGAEKEPVPA